MELIIDIPDEMAHRFKNEGEQKHYDYHTVLKACVDAIPLEKHDEEIIKETVESVWGKPCDDAISREAVDKLVNELAEAISDERCWISRGRDTATIMQEILDLPSVQPKPKTDVLDKIRAEIEETIQEETVVNMNGGEYEHTESKLDSDDVLQIINKYRKGQTDADSD